MSYVDTSKTVALNIRGLGPGKTVLAKVVRKQVSANGGHARAPPFFRTTVLSFRNEAFPDTQTFNFSVKCTHTQIQHSVFLKLQREKLRFLY